MQVPWSFLLCRVQFCCLLLNRQCDRYTAYIRHFIVVVNNNNNNNNNNNAFITVILLKLLFIAL